MGKLGCSVCLKKHVEWRESAQTKAKNRCVTSDSNLLREIVVVESILRRFRPSDLCVLDVERDVILKDCSKVYRECYNCDLFITINGLHGI